MGEEVPNPAVISPSNLKKEPIPEATSCLEPAAVSAPATPSQTQTSPAQAPPPLPPAASPSPRTVPASSVRLVVKPQGVKSVAPCSGRPSKNRPGSLTDASSLSSSTSSSCPMDIESQASEESLSPGTSPSRASCGTESLSSSQELDNMKSQPILANDNQTTSSTSDNNLIEKVDNRIAS